MSKKFFAALCASAVVLTACTACGGESSSTSSVADKDESSAAEGTTTTAETAAVVTTASTEPVTYEEAIEAESGDAYLAVTDSGWWAQYWGKTDSIANGLNLCYDAGVVHIDGDGQYKVSVTNDTKGARFDGTGDANGELVVSGIGFCGLIIKDGETVCPDAVITIDSIVVDGDEIELTATNYTCFEEGAVRSNLYNEWVSADNCPEGTSAQIFDRDKIGAWSTIEVNFTISGLGEGDGGSEDENTDDESSADESSDDESSDAEE